MQLTERAVRSSASAGALDLSPHARCRLSVGLDLIALKERWDAEHPDDPLELPPNYRSRAKRTAA